MPGENPMGKTATKEANDESKGLHYLQTCVTTWNVPRGTVHHQKLNDPVQNWAIVLHWIGNF